MATERGKIKTSIGGQALIEGVMMRGPRKTVATVRKPDGSLESKEFSCEFGWRKYPVLRIPLIRGVAGFIESMAIGYKTLMYSAEAVGEDEEAEPQSRFEKWLDKTFGDKLTKIASAIGGVLGILLAIILFFWLPTVLYTLVPGATQADTVASSWRAVAEGVMRIGIFLLYLVGISRMKDIRRVFQYHGAEHKTIFCYENQEPLTVENVRKHSRFHPRCGTSFLILMLLIGIVLGFFIQTPQPVLRTLIKLALLPLVMGIGYELIKICGRYDNAVTRVIAAPGLWMQRLTTKEPDDDMIEVAIRSLEQVIPENGEDHIP